MIPPNGSVVAPAPEKFDSDFTPHIFFNSPLRLEKTKRKHVWSTEIVSAGAFFGRAADTRRLFAVMLYLMRKYDVPDDQWALDTLRSGAGPAFDAFFRENVVFNDKLHVSTPYALNCGVFAQHLSGCREPPNPAAFWRQFVVVHGPMRSDLRPVLKHFDADLGPGSLGVRYVKPTLKELFSRWLHHLTVQCVASWVRCAQIWFLYVYGKFLGFH